MSWPRIRLLGLLGLGALLSQAGHLLAYQIQFGAAAQAVQSQGAHAYFPVVAKTGLGLGAIAVLGVLLVVGVARLFPGRPAVLTNSGPSYVAVLSTLFTVQLACFVVQEMIEAMVASTGHPSALMLVMMGSISQLPVAALAALAIKWLAVRFEAALITLGDVSSVALGTEAQLPILVPPPTLVLVPALAETCPAAYIKRGPPGFLRS